MKKTVWLVAAVVLIAALALALPALSQPGPPPGGGPGMMMAPGPGGPPMGAPRGGPPVSMVAADGVLYVACDGKVIAFQAKTLKKLAEATYWQHPQPPHLGRK